MFGHKPFKEKRNPVHIMSSTHSNIMGNILTMLTTYNLLTIIKLFQENNGKSYEKKNMEKFQL